MSRPTSSMSARPEHLLHGGRERRRRWLETEEVRHLRLHAGAREQRRLVVGARHERRRRAAQMALLLEEREEALAELGGRAHRSDRSGGLGDALRAAATRRRARPSVRRGRRRPRAGSRVARSRVRHGLREPRYEPLVRVPDVVGLRREQQEDVGISAAAIAGHAALARPWVSSYRAAPRAACRPAAGPVRPAAPQPPRGRREASTP